MSARSALEDESGGRSGHKKHLCDLPAIIQLTSRYLESIATVAIESINLARR